MTSKERMLAVLEGRRPDRVPVMGIFDSEYVLKAGGCPKEQWDKWEELSNEELASAISACRKRHPQSDLLVCTTGNPRRPMPKAPHISRVANPGDLPGHVPPQPSVAEVLDWGIYDHLPGLISRHGQDVLMAFVVMMPLPATIAAFGGYEDGLMAMMTEEDAFREVFMRLTGNLTSRMRAAASLGMPAVWITSYWVGTDTISPELYRRIVQPGEQLLFDTARSLGLKTLSWCLGNIVPVIPDILKNRPDLLVLEPGRKGYSVDLADVRRVAGPTQPIAGCVEEPTMVSGNRTAIATEIRNLIAKNGGGPLVLTTPILCSDVSCEAVDFYFAEATNSA